MRGRLLRVAVVAILGFAVGYWLAAAWIFPGAEGPADLRLLEVPNLVGRPSAEAASHLLELEFVPSVMPGIRSPDADPGEVLAQSPLPGQLARPGDTVRITPSRGEEERQIPDLTGVSARQATAVLERLGFETETRVVPSVGARGGVQGTRPAAGERVSLPAEIEILVGEGPQIAVVPDLQGRHVDDVRPLLGDAGLQLGDVRFDPAAGEAPGRVIGQSPPAGFSLRVGGLVSIEVAGESGEAGPPRDPVPTDTLSRSGSAGRQRAGD